MGLKTVTLRDFWQKVRDEDVRKPAEIGVFLATHSAGTSWDSLYSKGTNAFLFDGNWGSQFSRLVN